MIREPNWKLPSEALRRGAVGWEVKSEAGWGAAQAVFAPLRPGGQGWDLALQPGVALPLTTVNDDAWTGVPLPAADRPTHYLCMLRYDQPAERPGRTYFRLRVPGTPAAGKQDAAGIMALPTQVTAAELQLELARLQEALGERFARQLVRPLPAPPAALAAAAAPDELCFAFASCQYPSGMLDRPVAHGSYRALAAYLDRPDSRWPERLLLLGDQVYTDATSGLLDPVRLDDRFRLPYEEMQDREAGPWSELPQEFLGRVRMTPDDHEIGDNWEPFRPGGSGPRFRFGIEAYWRHQRPGEARSPAVQIVEQGPGWRLFMTDSRTQRPHRSTATLGEALILGAQQTSELEDWLLQGPPEQLKIVSSAALLLPRSRQFMDEPIYLDNWQGYPASLHRLLAFLCEHQVRNIVFLSGDTHLGCRTEVRVRNLQSDQAVRFQSCHAPALYAPYPFANESGWNLLLQDAFRFEVALAPAALAQAYECSVRTELLAQGSNGCTLLKARRRAQDWDIAVQVLR